MDDARIILFYRPHILQIGSIAPYISLHSSVNQSLSSQAKLITSYRGLKALLDKDFSQILHIPYCPLST
ncbi:MAG: hypothetical protein ACKO90_05480, partial [Microcystis panniformis]